MKDEKFEKLLITHFETENNAPNGPDFSVEIMRRVFAAHLETKNRKKIRANIVLTSGLVTAWIIILSSIWQTAMVQETLTWVGLQIQMLDVKLSWLKYPLLIIAGHALFIRLLFMISMVIGKRVVALR